MAKPQCANIFNSLNAIQEVIKRLPSGYAEVLGALQLQEAKVALIRATLEATPPPADMVVVHQLLLAATEDFMGGIRSIYESIDKRHAIDSRNQSLNRCYEKNIEAESLLNEYIAQFE